MIPKIIHYCWFGGKPLDEMGKKCLKSWKKYFPDYEIIEWNESNFDVNCCKYVKEAYEAKKYAFVSDYARYKILYEQGGVYFDTDVEVIKPFDDILKKGAFFGCENPSSQKEISVNSGLGCAVAPGLGCAVAPGLGFYKEVLDDYEKSSFYKEDGSMNLYTIVQRTTDLLRRHGLKDTTEIQCIADIYIYPTEYFCPVDLVTKKLTVTDKTYSIHHYAGSWLSEEDKYYLYLAKKYDKVLPNFFARKFARFQAIKKYQGRKAAYARVFSWFKKKDK